MNSKLTLHVAPGKTAYVLAGLAFIQIIISLAYHFGYHIGGYTDIPGMSKFHLDREANIPTYFSGLLLISVAALLGLIALQKNNQQDKYKRHWAMLSVIFLALSFDEVASIHELLVVPMRSLFGASGIFYFAWVIPGIAFVTILAISYWRFLWNLPPRSRNLFVLSAVIFVGGAIGFELMGGFHADNHGQTDLTYSLLTSGEETMEMAGVITFIYAILDYMRGQSMMVELMLDGRGEWPAAVLPNEQRATGVTEPAAVNRNAGDV